MKINKKKAKPIKLKKEFLEDYKTKILELYNFVLPLLKKGWTEDEMYGLFLFMIKNQKELKGKKLSEVLKLYKESVIQEVKKNTKEPKL